MDLKWIRGSGVDFHRFPISMDFHGSAVDFHCFGGAGVDFHGSRNGSGMDFHGFPISMDLGWISWTQWIWYGFSRISIDME